MAAGILALDLHVNLSSSAPVASTAMTWRAHVEGIVVAPTPTGWCWNGFKTAANGSCADGASDFKLVVAHARDGG